MSSSITEAKLSRVYFPLTGDPVGHHHLLLAESVLQQLPEIQLVIFIISNGIHPDPLKNRKITTAALRLEILKSALNDWSNPKKSIAAQIAEESGFELKLANNNSAVSRRELSYNRPMRLAEHIRTFSMEEKVSMIFGADLLERMLDPKIFTNEDLTEISIGCHLLLAQRNEIIIENILKQLRQKRGITLSVTLIKTDFIPQNLQRFFLISSTLIRRAAQAEHDLNAFLPSTSAQKVEHYGLYEKQKISFETQSSNLTELQQRLHELVEQLEESSKKLQKFLIQCELQKKPHQFSVLETSTGGKIAEAFTSLSGASKHFLEGRILYSYESQKQFLGGYIATESNVSQKQARDLAEAMLKVSGTDWALAETGMAGPPTTERRSRKNGQCHLALALSRKVRYKCLEFNPFLTRKEHQLLFAIEALNWATEVLQNLKT
ncbi:MAG: CinA family protein [SAR324 cluster bacterium]|nr:CinA family protein [SAR324 cluster bacterium]